MKSRPSSPSAHPAVLPDAVVPRLDKQIQIALQRALDVRFHGRRPSGGTLPLVLHFHGGTFNGGSLDSGAGVAQLLAQAGAVVMSVDYPLAPAHPFPQAVDTGYAALQWAWKVRHKLAGPGAPMVVAGEEAGGNLAAAIALMARDRQEVPLSGQILLSPMLDACVATASLREACAQARAAECVWANGWRQYLPSAADAGHPYAAPGTVRRLTGLPPALLVTAQDDPLRDETLAYAARLRAAGLAVQQAVLAAPTGWPGRYADAQRIKGGSPAWAGELRQQFRTFFAAMAATPEQAAPAFSSASSSVPSSIS
ncbi:alpha/beta hydrolase [Polaromonas sp. YR568]|uniref:alpha/beta hydrolase n=1 Tax=Polaromonas sp. YR568 TaxID=1855301 RepID=UPI003137B845